MHGSRVQAPPFWIAGGVIDGSRFAWSGPRRPEAGSGSRPGAAGALVCPRPLWSPLNVRLTEAPIAASLGHNHRRLHSNPYLDLIVTITTFWMFCVAILAMRLQRWGCLCSAVFPFSSCRASHAMAGTYVRPVHPLHDMGPAQEQRLRCYHTAEASHRLPSEWTYRTALCAGLSSFVRGQANGPHQASSKSAPGKRDPV